MRVVRDLGVEAQVDDALDAVPFERAEVAQPAHVVGADDHAVGGLAAVLERHAAEVAHVQAALPLQYARHVAAPR